jgi:hypothetical protein
MHRPARDGSVIHQGREEREGSARPTQPRGILSPLGYPRESVLSHREAGLFRDDGALIFRKITVFANFAVLTPVLGRCGMFLVLNANVSRHFGAD